MCPLISQGSGQLSVFAPLPDACHHLVSPVHQQVAGLSDWLRAAEGELARQLADKQAAQLQVAALSAEVAALQRERELLQEQAMSLQQEVSGWQTGSLLRDGPSGEELRGEGPLERSPSRTLATRMRELLRSPRRLALDASPSSQGSFRPPNGSRTASPSPRCSPGAGPAAEAAPGGAPPPLGPLGEGERLRCLQQQVAALEQRLASKEAQLVEQAAGAAAALAASQQEYAHLKEQATAAEAAATSVLQLRSSGIGAQGSIHQQCRAAIEGIHAQVGLPGAACLPACLPVHVVGCMRRGERPACMPAGQSRHENECRRASRQ